jgi:hypothetical protein
MKLAWILCFVALVTAVASEDPNLSANGDDFIMVAPGTLYLNGKSVGEYLGKVDALEGLVAMIMQENKDLKVCGIALTQTKLLSCSLGGKRSVARLHGVCEWRVCPTGGLWL